MMYLSLREMRRQSDLPPFRDYVRAARLWELFLVVGLFGATLGTFVVPWVLTGSLVDGVLGLVAFVVLWSVVIVPITLVLATRRTGPVGTYWDGNAWQYGTYRR